MNKNQLKGTLDEVVGTVKREAGKLTNDTPLQVEGIAQQVKGKIENAWGNAKDAARAENAEAQAQHGKQVKTAP